MVQMIRAAPIDLAQFDLSEFSVDDANVAIAHAADRMAEASFVPTETAS
jgi:hypothetical protein